MDSGQSTNLRVFVYGTLKRGQCRESCWPHAPRQVQSAFVRGQLYDLGDYPAILPGSDRVLGEIWSFAPSYGPATLAVLDEIEDFRNQPDDLYRRVSVTAWLLERDEPVETYTYLFAQPELLDERQRIRRVHEFCCWPPQTGTSQN